MLTLTAMLFVGGQSRRMGTDKATLRMGGESLWRRQLRVLSELRPQALWISARAQPAWCPEDTRIVLDEEPFCGPVSGLAPALSLLETTHLIALAVDLPLMKSDHLERLWALAGESYGIVPWNGNWFEPLCAIYPKEAAPTARAQLVSGNGSLQRLAQELEARNLIGRYVISDSEASFYHNVNRPGEVPPEPPRI